MKRGLGLMETGPVQAPTPGRTDLYDKDAPDGSYVVPADVVAHLGEGNTRAGEMRVMQMFPAYFKDRKGMVRHRKVPGQKPGFARGGRVAIKVAGGEVILDPDQVWAAGKGDEEIGKAMLDDFVKVVREDAINTLSNLPPPKGSH